MLARLETHVGEQRRFAANASHELRTPLAISQTLLDVAGDDPDRDVGELVERLHAVNARAIELTEALLVLSRADQRAFTGEDVDVSLIVEEATETLLPLAEKRGVTIHTAAAVSPSTGSPALLLQMVMNLLHNAIVHNLAAGGTVQVDTAADADRVTLKVENTGDELSPQLVTTLTEPFRRGTERIRSDQAGVGLGLAIVTSIVAAHDGTLTVDARAGGGLCVTVQLPAAARPGPRTPTNPAGARSVVAGDVPPEPSLRGRRVGGSTGLRAGGRAGSRGARAGRWLRGSRRPVRG